MATIRISQLPDFTNISDATLIPAVGNVSGALTTTKVEAGTFKNYVLGTLPANVAALQSNVGTLQSNVSTIQTSITNLTSNVTVLQGNIVTLTDSTSINSANILVLQGNVISLTSRTGALESNVSVAQADINVVESDIEDLQANILAVESNVTTLQSNVSTLQADFITLNNEVGAVSSEFAGIQNSFTSLEANVANISLDNVNGVVISSDTYNWTFANTGGLTFPDGTIQFTANAGSGGGGTASTGNITFDQNTISTNLASTINISGKPGQGVQMISDQWAQLSWVANIADPDSYEFGGNTYAWAYAGFEGTRIENYNNLENQFSQWLFDFNGNIIFPDESVQSTAFPSGFNVSVASSTISFDDGTGSQLILPTAAVYPGPNDDTTLINHNGGHNIIAWDLPNETSYAWNFTNQGNLVYPDSTAQTTAYQGNKSVEAIYQFVSGGVTYAPDLNVAENFHIILEHSDVFFDFPTGNLWDFRRLTIRIVAEGEIPSNISWDINYAAGGASLPTTTVLFKTITLEFMYNSRSSVWQLIFKAEEA